MRAQFSIQHNSAPWNEHSPWNELAKCQYQGDACLLAKLWAKHHSHEWHEGEHTRVVNVKTGREICTFIVQTPTAY